MIELLGPELEFDHTRMLNELNTLERNSSCLQLSVTTPPEFAHNATLDYMAGTNWGPLDDSIGFGPLVDESRFTAVSHWFRNTYFEQVYQSVASRYKLGRVRLLGLAPKTTYSWHIDPELCRIHIPIITNPGAMFIEEDDQGVLHVERLTECGRAYMVRTNRKHTAINASFAYRWHMVLNVLNPPLQDLS
jgi:hypothetical protein